VSSRHLLYMKFSTTVTGRFLAFRVIASMSILIEFASVRSCAFACGLDDTNQMPPNTMATVMANTMKLRMAELLSRSGKPDGNDPCKTPTPTLCALHKACL